MEEVADHVEDRAVQDIEAGLDGLIADGLDQMAFAWSRWPKDENILGIADELAGRQVEDLLPFDGRIELPVEVLQGLGLAEGGDLRSAFDETVLTNSQFILKDKFQEFGMGQAVGSGLLDPSDGRGEQVLEL